MPEPYAGKEFVCLLHRAPRHNYAHKWHAIHDHTLWRTNLCASSYVLPMRTQGYGTVRFTTAEAAQRAIEKFNEAEWEGRTLSVFMDKFA